MSRVRSARGEIVDFDVLKIKQQLTDNTVVLKPKKNFLDRKISKKVKQAKQPLVQEPVVTTPATPENSEEAK